MIGEKLSEVLVEIENTLWEFEANGGTKPEYTIDGFRAGIKIFMSVLMDRIWELQQDDKIDLQDRLNMANKAGEDVRKLIKIYTDIDTHELYK
ncbi:MAG: hypothetical protein DRN27_09235 [Thermoplasmata archaeon]|nr:MAG: hypothetical protein DRN27_09235 [Thermoplasmata archaeon]